MAHQFGHDVLHDMALAQVGGWVWMWVCISVCCEGVLHDMALAQVGGWVC